MWRHVVWWKSTHISKERVASIFRVKYMLINQLAKKQAGNCKMEAVLSSKGKFGDLLSDYTEAHPRR
jgi:hypothetical protein